MTLTVGSLFSGIGGIDLGLERAGMKVKWHSEIEPYACRVLKKHWPDVPNLGDIKNVDWQQVESVDVIAGGYPCQPFSLAGKRQGETDERHLWPHFLRAISVLRPRFAILENVRGHLSMGFDRVLGDLAENGYDAEWQIVSAASVGALHRRERIICLAYPNNSGSRTSECGTDCKRAEESQERKHAQRWTCGCSDSLANTDGEFLGKHRPSDDVRFTNRIWRDIPRGQKANDSREWWQTEPDVGRVADGVPYRVDRLRGLGNAVVPQVAEYIGRLIIASL